MIQNEEDKMKDLLKQKEELEKQIEKEENRQSSVEFRYRLAEFLHDLNKSPYGGDYGWGFSTWEKPDSERKRFLDCADELIERGIETTKEAHVLHNLLNGRDSKNY